MNKVFLRSVDRFLWVGLALILFWGASPLAAEPLQAAQITYIQHDVTVAEIDVVEAAGEGKVIRRKAELDQPVLRNQAVLTGPQSRAELKFNDGTLARLGQLSSFTFTPDSRNIELRQGTALFSVPKGMGRTQIQAGPVTAAITGTILMVQVYPDRVVISVYEGTVEAGGQTLTAGQTLTINNNGETTLGSFDPEAGINRAALFTRFVDAPSQTALITAIEEVLAAIEEGTVVLNDNGLDDALFLELSEEKKNLPLPEPEPEPAPPAPPAGPPINPQPPQLPNG